MVKSKITYNPVFVAKIKKSEKNFKEGKYISIKVENLWKEQRILLLSPKKWFLLFFLCNDNKNIFVRFFHQVFFAGKFF